MDQMKIGMFIAGRRHQLGLTQRQLAEKLAVSDKAVSKWECGKGFPEVSLMLPLCAALQINVNELLSGETLAGQYKEKAEENLVAVISDKQKEKGDRRRLLAVMAACFGIAVILWFLLFFDSNVYQLGDIPTRLTLLYLAVGFAAIYAVLLIVGLGIVNHNRSLILAALSTASFICLLISVRHRDGMFIVPAAAGMLICGLLSLLTSGLIKRNKS